MTGASVGPGCVYDAAAPSARFVVRLKPRSSLMRDLDRDGCADRLLRAAARPGACAMSTVPAPHAGHATAGHIGAPSTRSDRSRSRGA